MYTLPSFKIISGGQTGVDRGALDSALYAKMKTGGYCPKLRRSEDGRIPPKYNTLIESESTNYQVRTKQNIELSSLTVIFRMNIVNSPGTNLTKSICEKLNKPFLELNLMDNINENIQKIISIVSMNAFVISEDSEFIINFAGPRESVDNGIQIKTMEFVDKLILKLQELNY